eukprot:TRINITY_DN3196_c0_g1_i1.p1 TRINITY_DN3196_c0_g1~~TRINITY_DN3196_c0_g1_i1.p1  ORF type:complete len:271 (-),score=88.47 TRINITY_DN3196_c0_g1_i1:13-825(-)
MEAEEAVKRVRDEDNSEDHHGESEPKKLALSDDQANIKIQTLNLKGDYVTIINKGTTEVDISGWILKDAGSKRFTFPKEIILKPGNTVTVWSGKKSPAKQNPPSSLFWTKQYVWNDSGDTATLMTPDELIVDSHEEHPHVHPTGLTISCLDLISEYVSVINEGSESLDISGYFIKSIVGSQIFLFPENSVLKPGDSISIWSGKHSEKMHNPPSSIAWTKQFIWSNDGDAAVLYDVDGNAISHKRQFPHRSLEKKVTPPKHSTPQILRKSQ